MDDMAEWTWCPWCSRCTLYNMLISCDVDKLWARVWRRRFGILGASLDWVKSWDVILYHIVSDSGRLSVYLFIAYLLMDNVYMSSLNENVRISSSPLLSQRLDSSSHCSNELVQGYYHRLKSPTARSRALVAPSPTNCMVRLERAQVIWSVCRSTSSATSVSNRDCNPSSSVL